MAHIKSDLAEKQEIIKQFIQSEDMVIADLPLDPRVDAFITNNFLQGILGRMLVYNTSTKKWRRLEADSTGKLRIVAFAGSTDGDETGTQKLLRVDAGGRLLISTEEDLKEDLLLMDNLTVEASGTATHTGVDVGMYTKKTLLVETNRSMTVYMQGSTDNANFYDLKTIADADVTHNCTNEKIAIEIPFYCHFFRVSVLNSAGAQGLVTARLMCHA